MYQWTENRCCLILPAFLEGDASAAYDSLTSTVKKDWKRLVDELAKKLGRSEDHAYLRQNLYEIKQGLNETPLEFGMRISQLVKRAYPDTKNYTNEQRESIAVDHFINGSKIEYQEELMRKKPQI